MNKKFFITACILFCLSSLIFGQSTLVNKYLTAANTEYSVTVKDTLKKSFKTKLEAVYYINDGNMDKYKKAIELANTYKLPLIEFRKK